MTKGKRPKPKRGARRGHPRLRRLNQSRRIQDLIDLVNDRQLRRLVKKNKGLSYLPCFFCGRSLSGLPWSEITREHLQPHSQGGTDSQENLVLCCRECNGRKGSMSLAEFVEKFPPPQRAPVREFYPELFKEGRWSTQSFS